MSKDIIKTDIYILTQFCKSELQIDGRDPCLELQDLDHHHGVGITTSILALQSGLNNNLGCLVFP